MKSKLLDITSMLQETFENIRNDFFPRWDKDNLWQLKLDPSLPEVRINKQDFDLLTTYLGEGYGAVTREGQEAVDRARPLLSLETTYTGKTLAACMEYCQRAPDNERVLFWNTYNSSSFDQSDEYHSIPEGIQEKL